MPFKKVIEWDRGEGAVKGLHTQTNAAGSKAYYLKYRTKAGIQRRPKIGDAGTELTLTQARDVAREWNASIAVGGDPSAVRKSERDAHTLQEAFEVALEQHWGKKHFATSGYAQEVERIWEKNLKKKFGSLKIKNVTAPLVHEWHRQLQDTPNKANRSKAVLSKLLSFAEEKGWREPQSNPCFSVPNHPEKQRDRAAGPDELKKLVTILEREREAHPREVSFIELLIYTASRPRALERATKEMLTIQNVDGKDVGILTFIGKTGREVVIIPTQPLCHLLNLKQPREKTHMLVGIILPKDFWARIREEAGCPDLWARDLRRTFASIGLGDGVSIDKIGRTLNHSAQQTTLRYARLAESARISTTLQIANNIQALVAKADEL